MRKLDSIPTKNSFVVSRFYFFSSTCILICFFLLINQSFFVLLKSNSVVLAFIWFIHLKSSSFCDVRYEFNSIENLLS